MDKKIKIGISVIVLLISSFLPWGGFPVEVGFGLGSVGDMMIYPNAWESYLNVFNMHLPNSLVIGLALVVSWILVFYKPDKKFKMILATFAPLGIMLFHMVLFIYVTAVNTSVEIGSITALGVLIYLTYTSLTYKKSVY